MTSTAELPTDIKEALCKIKVKFRGQTQEFDLKDSLKIDYDDIEEEMEKLPHIYQVWAMLYAEVKEQKETIDKKIRKRKGILYKAILEESGGKNMRRGDITDLMEIDDVLEKLEAANIIVNKQCQKLWFILESLKMKNDNIRSLSGFKKQELYQAGQSV